MKQISEKLKQEILVDKYYQQCCLTGNKIKDGYKIDWHHAWTYAHGQISEMWAIMPVCVKKHSAVNGDKDSVHNCLETREYVKYLSLLRADLEDLKKRMFKKNWEQEFSYLSNKYKDYTYGEKKGIE